MPSFSVEQLEERLTPSIATLTGTDGSDSWYVFGVGDAAIALTYLQNGQQQLGITPLAGVSQLWINGAGGDDSILYSSSVPLFTSLGAGNDSLLADGAEGGFVSADGGAGDDLLVGGSSADTLIGSAGLDVLVSGEGADILYGGDGDDLLIAEPLSSGTFPVALWTDWTNPTPVRHERVVQALKTIETLEDASVDVIGDRRGFDLVYEGAGHFYQAGKEAGGVTHQVASVAELQAALAFANPGDTVQLAAGTYNLGGDITGAYPGITLRGAGIGQTNISGGLFRLNNQGDTQPTYLEEMTINLTGLPGPSGYLAFADGTYYLNGVEVYGVGQTDFAAVSFVHGPNGPTEGVILNSYVHDALGDLISTSGVSSDPAAAANSLLEIYNTTAHTAGPQEKDQVLSAHFGFRLVDVEGTYYDAASNVVAPDGQTRIDLYFTQAYPGSRSSNIELSQFDSIIDGVIVFADAIRVGGLVQNSTFFSVGATTQPLINVEHDNAIVRDNRIVALVSVADKKGVRSAADGVQLVDNVFEDWDGDEWLLTGASVTVEGNIVL